MSSMCASCKTKFYRADASSYINQKAPIISKEINVKEGGGAWYKSEIHEVKEVIRKTEK